MAGRQLDALRRQKVDERMGRRRRGLVHGGHHALVILRAGDGGNFGIGVEDRAGLGAHAAGDDHLAVLLQRLADGGERFGLGAVEKAAGVDDDRVRALVVSADLIAFRAQPGEDALAIDQRLGAAERDEGDFAANRQASGR